MYSATSPACQLVPQAIITNPVGLDDLLGILLYTAHGNGAGFGIQAAAQAIIDGLGLLKDLFQHEMIIAAFFNSRQL
jgi:hypothetical protein